MVRVFQTFASERQLRKITGNVDVKSASDYTPKPGDADYAKGSDVPWLKRFAADGGKVVISGDTRMKREPHERLALIECKFVVIFCESQWSDWSFFRKCALLLHWWPQIASTAKRARPGFWHVPCNWKETGRLRKVSTEDPRKLKLEKRKPKPRKSRAKPKADSPKQSDGPLFEYGEKASRVKESEPTED